MTALTSDRIRALEHCRTQPVEGASAAVQHAATEANFLFSHHDADGSQLAEFQAATTAEGRAEVVGVLLGRASPWERERLIAGLDAVADELAEVVA